MKHITVGLLLFLIPIGGFIAVMVYELIRLHRAKRKPLTYKGVPLQYDDPPGCPHCGVIAGACSAYPHCPGGMPQ